ncbi:hypothetical protein [Photobacterium damselae]|uniref:hypothetical protein n=1 Tax=Photobacterium damselae TaxID=38293 RepID=UPI0040696607
MNLDSSTKLTAEMKTVINCLGNGYTLINRGYGWLLGKPRKPHEMEESKAVANEVVNFLIQAGLVKKERSFFAIKIKIQKKAYCYIDLELKRIVD